MSPGPDILRPGRTCWTVAPADESAVIIDARAYYRAIHAAILRARRYVLMTGWQFDTNVQLLRGPEAERATAPTTFLPLLEFVCNRNPELGIYLLAWNFSPVYALERVWFQKRRFTWRTHENIHFEWDSWVPRGASHHQKVVVIDGKIAFSGGMDVCLSRWDGRDHLCENELRRSPGGRPNKPYHDVQAFVSGGSVVSELLRLFCDRWRKNTGQALELPEVEGDTPAIAELTDSDAFRLRAREVGLSQTNLPPHEEDGVPARQIRALYTEAVSRAEKLVYIENQYFTSRSLTRAFVERLSRATDQKLQIVIVMPRGGDSKKEKLALGEAQSSALTAIREAAERNGHVFRLYFTASRDPQGELVPTFIHSKLLVVDDRLLSVGSANTTNRSFGLDSELNLTWTADDAELEEDIRQVRATLMAEHAGTSELEPFLQIDGLIDRLDQAVAAGCRLCPTELEHADDKDPILSLASDPESPIDADDVGDRVEELLAPKSKRRRLKSGIERLAARVTKLDMRSDED